MNPEWHTEPPNTAGTYIWRRNYQWEPVEREVNSDLVNDRLTTFSHRYAQEVLLPAVGGDWFYGTEPSGRHVPGTWDQLNNKRVVNG